MYMNCGALGGGNWYFDPIVGIGQQGVEGGFGLNNIGLLVRVCGSFRYVNAHEFDISDGSGKVNCIIPDDENITGHENWTLVSVTGISSCRMGTGGLDRLLRVHDLGNIVPLQ
jgi:hypothetical protein